MTVSIYDNHERLADLVRYARVHLLEEGLITDDEYAELALDGDAKERVKRLESYDALRERLADCEGRNAGLRIDEYLVLRARKRLTDEEAGR